jgi:hypothetical protein
MEAAKTNSGSASKRGRENLGFPHPNNQVPAAPSAPSPPSFARWQDIQDANFGPIDGTVKLKVGMTLAIP